MTQQSDISSALATLGAAGWATNSLAPSPSVAFGFGGYQQSVSVIPTVLFYDNFNGTTIDTTNRWSPAVIAGTGTMTQSSGNLIATVGTTASNGAAINTQESFEPSIGGDVSFGVLLNIEAAPTTNSNRCVGFYTRPGSFAAATPVQDGYVWEYAIDGTFGASVYSGGTRVFRQTFSLSGAVFVPLRISYNAVSASFYFGATTTPSVIVGAPFVPSTLNLPYGFHCINHTSGPATAPTWSQASTALIDSSGTIQTVFGGQSLSRMRSPTKFIALNAVSVASETTIWTPASGRKFRLMGYNLTSLGAAGNVVLKDNTAGASLPIVLPFGAIGANLNTPYPGMGNGILSAAANNVLTATGAASQTLSGYLFGTEE